MCVPIFSYIGFNSAKIDLSKVVYKNTRRCNHLSWTLHFYFKKILLLSEFLYPSYS